MGHSLRATEPWLFKWKAPPLPKGIIRPPPPPSDGPGYAVEYYGADGFHYRTTRYAGGGFQPDPAKGFIINMLQYILPSPQQVKAPTYSSISLARNSGSLGY